MSRLTIETRKNRYENTSREIIYLSAFVADALPIGGQRELVVESRQIFCRFRLFHRKMFSWRSQNGPRNYNIILAEHTYHHFNEISFDSSVIITLKEKHIWMTNRIHSKQAQRATDTSIFSLQLPDQQQPAQHDTHPFQSVEFRIEEIVAECGAFKM